MENEFCASKGEHAAERVVVAYLHPWYVDGNFCASLMELVLWDQQNAKHIVAVDGLACGTKIGMGRNRLCVTFLVEHTDADWLLMLDSDMTFSRNLVDNLLAVAGAQTVPVVSGLYFAGHKDGKISPEMYMCPEGFEAGQLPVGGWEPGTLLRVDAVGAGCLLIHRSVLAAMWLAYPGGAPWFDTEVEDIEFCRRLQEIACPLAVDTSIVLGHCKRTIIDDGDYRRYSKRVAGDGTIEPILTQISDELRAKMRWSEGKGTTVELGAR